MSSAASRRDDREAAGIEASTPEEQASALAFSCSDAAGDVNGSSCLTDAGSVSSAPVGSFDASLVKLLPGVS